jgi:hypothetical protein
MVYVTAVSPRVDERLRHAAELLDDPTEPYAEIWRRVCIVAEQLGLTRPGYDTIRLALRDLRRRREEVRRLMEPVVSDALRGRLSVWGARRVIEARAIARNGPATSRNEL